MPFLLAEIFKIALLTILAKKILNLENLFRRSFRKNSLKSSSMHF